MVWYLSDLPGIGDALNELIISIKTGRNAIVVVLPFLFRDFSVDIFISESSEELVEDIILGHLTRLEFGVGFDVIACSFEVINGDGVGSVNIKLVPSSINYCLSLL